jgi:O-acetylhomoserine (thiol)-lyase
MGNPKLDIPDIKAISKISMDARIPLVIDSTLTTPYLFKSRDFGAGIVIHSATKYMSGNGTSIGGILVDLGIFDWSTYKDQRIQEQYKRIGEMAFLQIVRGNIIQNIGFCMSPFNAFLHNLGLETLALRMEKHCSNALELAKFLNKHPKVISVNYPGLSGNISHDMAKKQFNGKYGGLLTFELNSKEECFRFINHLKLVLNLANLGDAKTLVIHPASTIYHESTKEEMETAGVTNNLIRVSVGIESVRDIINDFKNALEEI